ncbi:MAG TPA: endo-1,4-beta-xylanase [Candidatus Acidoferrales bacterium]|nr:endo-1,4-beta-xylanase [Candidatus Acidoferrales bacterium]
MKKISLYIKKDFKRWIILVLLAVSASQAHAQTGWGNIQTNVPELKNVYAKDFYIGCILSYPHIGFTTDPPVPGQSAVVDTNGGYLVKFHMNSMSPGNNMKPMYTVNISASAAAYSAATTQAQKDSINTHPIITFNGNLIAQLNWAQRQGFTFRGHTLVWHNQTPTQFFRTGYTTTGGYVSKDTMIQRMGWYIHEVIRSIHQSWPGLLSAIDVVNEAIADGTGAVRTTGNEWYTVFGDSTYVMTAFQLARQYTQQYGETQIKLYYNDYNTEVPTKADGIVRLLTPIYQAGYLDGIGMQNHNSLSTPTAQTFIDSYNKFYPICNEMAVTELDVTTGTSTPSASQLAAQANQYGMLFKCFVERSYRSGRGKIVNVTKDGLNDKYTFVTTGATSLWDSNDQCKPAFFAVADVGTNYNALDSLISYADSLHESKYTASSWSQFAAALDSSKSAMAQEYSVSVSADTALSNARVGLQTAIAGLVLNIVKMPVINISSHSIDFGAVPYGSTKKDTVQIYNTGTDTLKVTSITSTDTTFTFAPAAFNIAPSDSLNFVVTFAPREIANYTGFIILTHDAAGSPDSIPVSGQGIEIYAVHNGGGLPTEFALSQNYPNPFNPSTTINYQLPVHSRVTLKVYDVLGREVATLVNERKDAGYYNVSLDAGDLPSGVYFYRIETEKFTDVKKFILIK